MFARVRLAPLAQHTLAPMQALTVKPFQSGFIGGQPGTVMAAPEAGFDPHVILDAEDRVVGLFRVQTSFHLGHTFARSDTPGLATFVIDAGQQGKGLGTEACQQMPAYLRNAVPRARGAYALVHQRNTGALKAMLRGGWTDTGTQHSRAASGPQAVLWLPLR